MRITEFRASAPCVGALQPQPGFLALLALLVPLSRMRRAKPLK
jgi:hypothetical protein